MSAPHIAITDHAADRFRERVRPALDPHAARAELDRLVAMGELGMQAPTWFAARSRERADAFLVIGDLVLPLVQLRDGGLLATTCIARGGISETARARRNRVRSGSGRRAKARRLRHGSRGRMRAAIA